MYLLQSMILVRARMDEITRFCEPSGTRKSPARSGSALRIKLDAGWRGARVGPAEVGMLATTADQGGGG